MKRIRFLADPTQSRLASSTLRSEQLCTICRYLFADDSLNLSVCFDFSALRDDLVIISKSFLITATPQDIDAMRNNGNLLIGDWLDYRIRLNISALLHGFIASSRQQHKYLCSTYPEKPTFHVTHHVDLRIPLVNTHSADRLRMAYFGNLSNARFKDSFGTSIDAVNAWDGMDVSWMDLLPKYNCHYAVRTAQQWDGFKPFTKGFIAAHCNAVIVVDEDDLEAAGYLGEDYPFRLRLRDDKDFKTGMQFLSGTFNSPVWQLALRKMDAVRETTSPRVLKVELAALLQLAH